MNISWVNKLRKDLNHFFLDAKFELGITLALGYNFLVAKWGTEITNLKTFIIIIISMLLIKQQFRLLRSRFEFSILVNKYALCTWNFCINNLLWKKYVLSFFFPFIFISWRLITLQYCSGFCHTLTWISHGFTCVPHLDPPSRRPLHPIPLVLSFKMHSLALCFNKIIQVNRYISIYCYLISIKEFGDWKKCLLSSEFHCKKLHILAWT